MNKSKKIWFALIVITAIFAFGAYVAFFKVKPILPPSLVNKENIEKLFWSKKLNKEQEKKTITGVAASLRQLPKAKQRGLWHKLASYCRKQQAIDYYQKEIVCWPEGTANATIVDCLLMIGSELTYLEKYKEAEKQYLHILSLSPGNLDALVSYAHFLEDQKRNKDAYTVSVTILEHPKLENSAIEGALNVFHDINCFEEGILKAIDVIEQHKPEQQQGLWLKLGLLCSDKKYSFKLEENFYKRALSCSLITKNADSLADSYNSLGHLALARNNIKQAKIYYRKALTHYSKQMIYRDILEKKLSRLNEVPMNINMAQLQQSVDSGDIDSQYVLGKMYLMGNIFKKNSKKAVELLRNAAVGHNISAMYYYAYCLKNGLGTDKNQQKAVKWFQKGAGYNNANCQYNLGKALLNGDDINKDQRKAFLWFLCAAEQGHAEAQYAVGKCFLNGIGIIPNNVKAAKWLRISAEQGNGAALELIEKHDFISKSANKKWVKEHDYSATDWEKQGLQFEKEQNPQIALECFREALHIYEMKKDLLNQAIILSHLGKIIIKSSSMNYDIKKSLPYLTKSILIFEAHFPDDKTNLILSYTTLGNAYLKMHDVTAALKSYMSALNIAGKANSLAKAYTYRSLGMLYMDSEPQKSNNFFTEAIKLFNAKPDFNSGYLVQTYFYLALNCKKVGDSLKAVEYLKKSIDILKKHQPHNKVLRTKFEEKLKTLQNTK
jgi:TPR repeat protein